MKIWKGWEDGTSGEFGVSLSSVVGSGGFEMHPGEERFWKRGIVLEYASTPRIQEVE